MGKRFLFFVFGLVCVYTCFYHIGRCSYQRRAEKTMQQAAVRKLDAYSMGDSLHRTLAWLNPYLGKYIELTGVLLTTEDEAYDTYLDMTGGRKIDSGYAVAFPLDYQKILAKKSGWSKCDSAIVRYQRLHHLHEAPFYLHIHTDIVGKFNRGEGITYNRNCEPYTITTTKRYNYNLHNFCYEQAYVRGKLYSIDTLDGTIRVVLADAVLLGIKDTEK